MICLYYFNVKFIKRAEGFKSSIFSLSFPSVLLLGTQETIYRFISFLFGLYHGLSRNYHPCYRSYYLVLSCDWAEVGNGSSRSKYFPLSAPGCRMGNCLHWVERKDFWRLSFFFYFFPTAVAAAGRSPRPHCEIAAAFCRWMWLILSEHHISSSQKSISGAFALLQELFHPTGCISSFLCLIPAKQSIPLPSTIPLESHSGLACLEPPMAIGVSSVSELRSDAQLLSMAQGSFLGLAPE